MKRVNGKMSGDVRRRQIVQAALRIIARKGVSGLTTAGLAKEVGVSEANLYRHFKNKDAILYETGKSVGQTMGKNLETMLSSDLPPLQKLKRIFTLQLDFIEKNEGIPRLIYSEEMHISNEKLRLVFLDNLSRNAAGLESLIREVQKAGAIRPGLAPGALAAMMMGMVMVTIMRWSLNGFSFSLAAEGKKLWNNFEKCIAAKPARR